MYYQNAIEIEKTWTSKLATRPIHIKAPSAFSSETLPKPITKRKDKGYKKKLKDAPTSFCTAPTLSHDPLSAEPCKPLLDRAPGSIVHL
jgi:hypothetical protein